MKNTLLLLLIFLGAFSCVLGQDRVWMAARVPGSGSPGANERPPAFDGVPMPPPPPVRTMAEWEEVQAIVVTWDYNYANVLKGIIRHSQEECTVIVIYYDPLELEAYLLSEGIPLNNVEFLAADSNSVWIRDYGPWSIYHNDADSLMIVDWIYDDPTRMLDDRLSPLIAARLGLPVYEAAIEPPYDWIHAGGNNLQDGMGSLFSSELVLETNPDKTMAEIEAIAQAFLGITPGRYFTMPVLPFDSIHHLDMHMRFLDEETILVGQYPEGVADGPQIEHNVEFLRQLTTAFGNPYEIIRIPMPPDTLGRYPDEIEYYRTYTNGIFVNKTYLMPAYQERYDSVARRIYREHLPGYTIAEIDCDEMADNFGAIHCVTKLIGVHDPLRIAHARLQDTENNTAPYPVEAIIQHRSGITGATLYYRIAPDSLYAAVPMTLENAQASLWAAAIPAQPTNTEVQYYIHATAQSGKEQVRPMVAPEGYFRFRVLPPSGAHEPDAHEEALTLDIYPNPAAERAYLRFASPKAQMVYLKLANQQGQVVWSEKKQLPAGESQVLLQLGRRAGGAYHLTVFHERGRIGRALVLGM